MQPWACHLGSERLLRVSQEKIEFKKSLRRRKSCDTACWMQAPSIILILTVSLAGYLVLTCFSGPQHAVHLHSFSSFHQTVPVHSMVNIWFPRLLERLVLYSSIHFLILQSFCCGNQFYAKEVRYFWKQPQKLYRLTREKYVCMKQSV